MAGLAVFGCCIGFALTCGRWLDYETYDRQRGGLGCADDGGVTTQTDARSDCSSDEGS